MRSQSQTKVWKQNLIQLPQQNAVQANLFSDTSLLLKLSYSVKFTNILNLLVNLFVKITSIFTNDIKLNSETVTTTLFNHFYYVLFTNHDEITIGETQNLLLNLILIVDSHKRCLPQEIYSWIHSTKCLNPLAFYEKF